MNSILDPRRAAQSNEPHIASLRLTYPTLLVIAAIAGLLSATAHADTCSDLIDVARQLLAEGRNDEAIVQFELIRDQCSPDQRTLVEMVQALHDAGRYADVTAQVDEAIQMNGFTHWAAVGSFYKASACRHEGCFNDAHTSVQLMRDRFPDSSWTTRAEIVEAIINDQDLRPWTGAWAREQVAESLYRQAIQTDQSGDTASALAQLSDLIADYSDTRSALAALSSEAFLSSRDRANNAQTLQLFESLYVHAAANWPQARITNEIGKSLAYIYKRMDRRQDAQNVFDTIMLNTQDPNAANEAAVAGAGAQLEVLHKRRMLKQEVKDAEWLQMLDRLETTATRPGLTVLMRSRIAIMIVEIHHWKRDWAASLAGAEAFIATYTLSDDRSAVGTAHIIAGEALRYTNRIEEGLAHFQWVIQEFQDTDVWPELVHESVDRPALYFDLARAYYWEADALHHLGVPVEEVLEAYDYVISNYPGTRYAELLERARNRVLSEQAEGGGQ